MGGKAVGTQRSLQTGVTSAHADHRSHTLTGHRPLLCRLPVSCVTAPAWLWQSQQKTHFVGALSPSCPAGLQLCPECSPGNGPAGTQQLTGGSPCANSRTLRGVTGPHPIIPSCRGSPESSAFRPRACSCRLPTSPTWGRLTSRRRGGGSYGQLQGTRGRGEGVAASAVHSG